MEKRIEQAVENFKSGFNCSQAVAAAFADYYGVDRDVILRAAASFGGGIGRMRQTCGAACGMFLLAGLENGSATPKDVIGRDNNYKLVQQLAEQFAAENGSLICGELLGLTGDGSAPKAKRPCAQMVESAARIFAEYLKNKAE